MRLNYQEVKGEKDRNLLSSLISNRIQPGLLMKSVTFFLWCSISMMMSVTRADVFEDGMIAFEEGEYTKAVELWSSLAEQGDVQSQIRLGIMYARGNGVQRDGKEAQKWFQKAADLGSAEGEYNLGVLCENARSYDMPADFEAAMMWYRKAAEKGHIEAQYSLGVNYFRGVGVPQDNLMSYAWMNLAASQGHTHAENRRDLIASIFTSEELARATELAGELLAKYGHIGK